MNEMVLEIAADSRLACWWRTADGTSSAQKDSPYRGADAGEILDEGAKMDNARVPLHSPASLEAAAGRYARRDGVSPNRFVSTAAARKAGGVDAEEFLREHGAGDDRERAVAFLRAAPDMPPSPADERTD